mmetsp:Transcript_124274/g.175284  ORF Transcript_124274/g.175284 Transcript_124274/m.175284 type:complete len:166 (-) Transcript_124274:439-936(-)
MGTQPGAIPVATPVPEVQAYQQHQAAALAKATSNNNNNNGKVAPMPAAGTVVASQTIPINYNNKNSNDAMFTSSMGKASDPTLSRNPMMMKLCPHCHLESRTRVTTSPTWQTWTASGVLIFVFWPVCWLPLVLDNCKETNHHCVLCGNQVGHVQAFQDCCVTTAA